MKKRKFIAGLEIVLIVVSFFSFCHFFHLGEDFFPLALAAGESEDNFREFLQEFDVVGYDFGDYSTSSGAVEAGCCLVSKDKQVCGVAAPENCDPNSPFSESNLCSGADFCQKGCCYNASLGIYDRNVIRSICKGDWVADPNCNLPDASLGCCILGDGNIFETKAQCDIDGLDRSIGGISFAGWDEEMREGECLYPSNSKSQGACLIGNEGCDFVGESECESLNGNFYSGKLCSSPGLKTSCRPTEQTMCVEGKDEVYFVDSCGNPANVYDSSRARDLDYWDDVIDGSELCGDNDVEKGGAENPSCGNCNRYFGGACASAVEDNFDVDMGNYYCRDMSCEYNGKTYENGESWCVYDGAIGEGRDIVGSRHWKYVCSQGNVQVEPCADYRNQVCTQSVSSSGFSDAGCVANNWRACVGLNDNTNESMEECKETLNCFVDSINVSDYFTFDYCAPKYPGGFSFDDARYTATADKLCGMATVNCTVVQEQKTWGGCKYAANEECLTDAFADDMGEFCRSIGDCGPSVNIVGEYTENYKVKKDGTIDKTLYMSKGAVDKLKSFANAIEGLYAEVENYGKYNGGTGNYAGPEDAPDADNGEDLAEDLEDWMTGIGGLGTAMKMAGIGVGSSATTISTAGVAGIGGGTATTSTTTIAGTGSFAGAAIGAAAGMAAGAWIAKEMELSPGGSTLMTIGGGIVGAVIGYYAIMGPGLAAISATGVGILVAGLVLMVVAAFMAGDDCDSIYITFECNRWSPPSGGSDCEKCNDDPLKPCSEYRCKSLGSTCEIINVGEANEICVDGKPNDVTNPTIARDTEVESNDVRYVDARDGFSVRARDGGCLDPNENAVVAITTSELTKCAFDFQDREKYEDMGNVFGADVYSENHRIELALPDIRQIENISGSEWGGTFEMYVKCIDKVGLTSQGTYKIDLCVSEEGDGGAPSIVKGEVGLNGVVGFLANDADINVVVSEAAECRWSFDDVRYYDMENDLNCGGAFDTECTGSVPVFYETETYYVRCLDQPWLGDSFERNPSERSYVLNLRKATSSITIDSIWPTEDFVIGSDLVSVELGVRTSGGGDYHFCSYSFNGYENMIDFVETGYDREHANILNIGRGEHKIYIQCRDETGEFTRSFTEFEIEQDSSLALVSRVWNQGGVSYFKLNEESECRVSMDGCNFIWSEAESLGIGTNFELSTDKGKAYNIKCKDSYGNTPALCTLVLRIT